MKKGRFPAYCLLAVFSCFAFILVYGKLFLQPVAEAITWGEGWYDNIEMADDKWIGLGAAAGRIVFDDQATDQIHIAGHLKMLSGADDIIFGNYGFYLGIDSDNNSASNIFAIYNNGSTTNVLWQVQESSQIQHGQGTHGGYIHKIYEATSGTLTGATDKIELNIPTGWVIKACQLHVKTAVTNAGDNTWSAELNDGAQEEAISAGSAAAQNTNVTHFASGDAGYGGTLTDAETDILLTPQAADFTGGEIEAHCLCFGFDTWDNE
jgi:hypothetical protein